MKASAKNQDDNNMDALLFAYVEGELTDEEVNQLEEKLAADASLQTDLKHWKESFVTQDFYATDKLEQSLLKEKVTAKNPASYTFICVTALITFLLSFLPLSVEKATVADPVNISKPESLLEEKKSAEAQPAKLILKEEHTSMVPQNQYKTRPIIQIKVLPEQVIIRNLPIPLIIPLEAKPSASLTVIPETQMKKLVAKKISGKRIITRKERKKIIQMKERAIQQRKANEFLKGRVPYVVPLNTNNF